VVLTPLFEHGGLDALTKAVQDAFHHLHIHEDELTDWTGYGSTHESNDCINTDEEGENRQETVLKSIQDARQSLNQTRDFVYMLTAQMLMETEHKVVAKEEKYEKRRISNLLNFMSTFLHLTDYYIVGKYALVWSNRHTVECICADRPYFQHLDVEPMPKKWEVTLR
jgi:hypothetical protein